MGDVVHRHVRFPFAPSRTPLKCRNICVLDKLSPEFPRALRTFTRLDEDVEYSVNLTDSESVEMIDGECMVYRTLAHPRRWTQFL